MVYLINSVIYEGINEKKSELSSTKNGKPYVNFVLRNSNCYMNIECWEELAKKYVETVESGDYVRVYGRLKTYIDGKKNKNTSIVALGIDVIKEKL